MSQIIRRDCSLVIIQHKTKSAVCFKNWFMELNVVLLLVQSAEEWIAGLLPITDTHLP